MKAAVGEAKGVDRGRSHIPKGFVDGAGQLDL